MTMTTVKDEWVLEAMTDNYVVVELLVKLKQAKAASPAPKTAVAALRWGIHKPRSRPMLMRCDAKLDGDFNVSSRGSPTTPLSWSGGGGAASPSATDGYEETSSHLFGSPPTVSSRSKTFAELKEEENLLLNERFSLKEEIASMRATCKEHRARNDNLKRIKLDMSLDTAKMSSLVGGEPEQEPSCEPCQRLTSSLEYIPSTLPLSTLDDRKPLLDSCNEGKAISSEETFSLLPDLNMMPADDDTVWDQLIQ